MIMDFWAQVQRKVLPTQAPGRLKQWLNLMRRSYPQAETMFASLRALRTADDVTLALKAA